ncbi:MAG: S8 family serine peptidase, partial [Planctomycetota bacterium]
MKDSFTRMAMLRRARKSIRKRRCRQRRLFERLEVRHLLSGDASPGLRIESTFEADSLLVRFHEGFAGAYVTAPDTSRSLNAVPGLQQIATPEQLNVSQAIESYSLHPGVLYAEPNYSISLSATPNDSSYTDLWGLNNGGQTGGTTDADIDAAEAWDITTGSRDTIVAVVDTGVDYLHPDLAANMWVNPGEVAGDGIDNDGNGFVDDVYGYNFVSNNGNPMDDHDHGTHVAGTIGAVANNGVGVVGVSWDVQIMAVKFLDARGGGSTGNAIAAIQYAVDNGATISNHSWGFNGGFSQALADAIEYARQADHLVIAAAGNGGRDRIGDNNDAVPFYPGNFPNENLISIAATDHNDQLASFSNFGATQVDLGAPGVAILSTTRSGGYETFSGTSMATPHASGVAALLRSAYPGWTYDRVRDRLLDTVDPLDALQGITTTGGRLNAASAVAIDTTGPVVVQQTPAGDVMRAQGSLQISFDERLDTASFTVSDIASFNGPSGPIVPSQIVAVPGTRGKDFEVRFPQQVALGSYELVLGTNILDVFGNPMDSAATLSFNIIPDTVGPYIESTLPDQATDQPTDRVRVIFDEPIDATTFTPEDIEAFTGPGGTVSVLSIEEVSSSEFDVVFPTQDAQGIYQFTVSGDISDPAGNKLDQDRDGLQGEAIDDELTVSFELQRWLYADHVVDFSSQYTTTLWSAAQALGPPDTFNYGDIETAWAPRSENGTSEFLTLGFSEPLLASGVVIRETFGNGFVRSIELRDEKTGLFHLVSQPIDDSRPGTPVDFLVTWPQTSFGADAILITIDTDHDLNAFEEIDSVQLRGWSVPDLDGARVLSSSVSGSTEGPVDRIELSFDEPIADGTFTLEDVSNLVGPEGEVPIEQVNRLTSTRYEVVFPPQSTFGDYSMSVGPDIVDLQGLPMNQDRDEFDGEIVDDAFAIGFRVEKWQYAGEVIDYSSQYSPNSWSASEVLGPPDSPIYGDQRTAWAPANMNGTTEFVSVSFPEPVLSSGVMVRETFGNGFVRGIDLRDADTGGWTSMSIPADQSQPGQPAEYVATWPLTDFEVDGVRVQIDTDQTANFEEIDAIQLRGVPAPDLQGPAIIESDPESGHPGPLDHIDLVFSEAINENTFTAEDVETLRGPSGPILLSSITKLADDRFQLSFPEQTEKGSYQLRIGSAIEDLYGNQMESAFDLFIELELWQYASSVIDFSSQYSATSWSAAQALGAPDTLIYGDARTAWAPSSINGTTETLTLGFDTPVQSSGAIIRQTFGNVFVLQIDVVDASSCNFEVVSTATD